MPSRGFAIFSRTSFSSEPRTECRRRRALSNLPGQRARCFGRSSAFSKAMPASIRLIPAARLPRGSLTSSTSCSCPLFRNGLAARHQTSNGSAFGAAGRRNCDAIRRQTQQHPIRLRRDYGEPSHATVCRDNVPSCLTVLFGLTTPLVSSTRLCVLQRCTRISAGQSGAATNPHCRRHWRPGPLRPIRRALYRAPGHWRDRRV
jgi:hypothetical protein